MFVLAEKFAILQIERVQQIQGIPSSSYVLPFLLPLIQAPIHLLQSLLYLPFVSWAAPERSRKINASRIANELRNQKKVVPEEEFASVQKKVVVS